MGHYTEVDKFHCAECGAVLSGPVRRVPMPESYIDPGEHDVTHRPMLMEPGTYSLDPAECYEFPGLRDTYVLASGDVWGTRFVFENCGDGCIGFHSEAGGNLACASCGALVGSRTDACSDWQRTRLNPQAVRAVKAPDPQPQAEIGQFVWEVTHRDLLGDALGEPRKDPRAYAFWQAEVIGCLAQVLAETGGSLIVLVGQPVQPLGSIATALLGEGRFPRMDQVRSAGTAGIRRLLEPVALPQGPGELTLLSLEHSSSAVAEAAQWLTQRAEQIGLALPLLRLVNVQPTGHEYTSSAVRQIELAEPVWRYLARVAAGDRILAVTRWQKPGLAMEVYRDDPPYPDLAQAAVDELAQEFRYAQRYLGMALLRQAQREEPWLEELAARLWPYRVRPLRDRPTAEPQRLSPEKSTQTDDNEVCRSAVADM